MRKLIRRNVRLGRLAGLLGLSILIAGLLRGMYGLMSFGRAAALAWSLPSFSLAGIFFAGWLLMALVTKQRRVLVHQHGVSFWKSKNMIRALKWSEISGISYLQEEWSFLKWNKAVSKGILFPGLGKPIRLDQFCQQSDLPELVTRLKAHLYPYLETRFRKCLREKRPIYFGTIRISSEGIWVDGKETTWEEIQQLNIQNGFLVIRLKDRNLPGISLLRVPNVELLFSLALLAREMGAHRSPDKLC